MEDFKTELKEKLDNKIDKEYENLLADLRNSTPQVIIERAYEKVSKEEMIYRIKEKDYTINELKILLKQDNLLQERDWKSRVISTPVLVPQSLFSPE